jgi:SAM-dependent methyltransferase
VTGSLRDLEYQPYGADFFAHLEWSAESSAPRVMPVIVELLAPRSIVDVGCGLGTWLAAGAELGIDDYLGVDVHAPEPELQIPVERFARHDLSSPLRLDRRFDLVIALEVAEHLAPEAAEMFVDSLVGLGPAVLFSAAVPHQSGEEHLNERWPQYWVERFAARGLVAVDAIRPRIWDDDAVSWWYRQNTLLFCEPELIDRTPALRSARAATRERQLDLVHPLLYRWMVHQRDLLAEEVARRPALRELLRMLPRAGADAARRRLRRDPR